MIKSRDENMENLETAIGKRRWNFYEHMQRMGPSIGNKKFFEINIQYKKYGLY